MSLAYDGLGRVTETVDARSMTTVREYDDPLGLLTRVIQAQGTSDEAITIYA